MHSILLVEDSTECQILVKRVFNEYRVTVTNEPDEIMQILSRENIALIILDIGLSKRDGYSLLHELQSSDHASIPIVCLTSNDTISNKITAFNLGADDVLPKPFHSAELKARVESRLRKANRNLNKTSLIRLGGLTLDLDSHRAYRKGGEAVDLTRTEFRLLALLARRPGNVFSREALVGGVWGDESAVFDRAVDVHICSLRKKLQCEDFILRAVPGIGYRIDVRILTSKSA